VIVRFGSLGRLYVVLLAAALVTELTFVLWARLREFRSEDYGLLLMGMATAMVVYVLYVGVLLSAWKSRDKTIVWVTCILVAIGHVAYMTLNGAILFFAIIL
jgi:hypothetical protein